MAPPCRLRCRGRRRGVGNVPRRPWNPSLVSDLSQRFALRIRFSVGPRHRLTHRRNPNRFAASGPSASAGSPNTANRLPSQDSTRNTDRRLECRLRAKAPDGIQSGAVFPNTALTSVALESSTPVQIRPALGSGSEVSVTRSSRPPAGNAPQCSPSPAHLLGCRRRRRHQSRYPRTPSLPRSEPHGRR